MSQNLDISFNEVSPSSRLNTAGTITPYWRDIAGSFGFLENMLALAPNEGPSEQAWNLIDKLANGMVKLSAWNELADEGLIPVRVEVDGEIQKISYGTLAYKIKVVAST